MPVTEGGAAEAMRGDVSQAVFQTSAQAYGNWADGAAEEKKAASSRVAKRLSPPKRATVGQAAPVYLNAGGQPVKAHRYPENALGLSDTADNFETTGNLIPGQEPDFLMTAGQAAPRYSKEHRGKDQADHFKDHAGFIIDTELEGTQTEDRPDLMMGDGKTAAVPKYGAGHEHKDTEDNFLENSKGSFLEPEVGHDVFADKTAKYGSGHEDKDTESSFKSGVHMELGEHTVEDEIAVILTSPNGQPLTNLEISMMPVFGAAKDDAHYGNRKPTKGVKLQAMGGGVAVPQTREDRLALKKDLKAKTLAIKRLKPPKAAKKGTTGTVDYRKTNSKRDAKQAAERLLILNATKTPLPSVTNSRSSSNRSSASSKSSKSLRRNSPKKKVKKALSAAQRALPKTKEECRSHAERLLWETTYGDQGMDTKGNMGEGLDMKVRNGAVQEDFETSYGREGLDTYGNLNDGLSMHVKGVAKEDTFETSYGTHGLDSKDNVGKGLDLVPSTQSLEELGHGRLPGFGRDMLDSLENLRVDMVPNDVADAADKKWETGPAERGIKDATSLTSSLIPAPEPEKVPPFVVVSKPKKVQMKYGGRVSYTPIAEKLLSRFSAKGTKGPGAPLAFPGYPAASV